MADRGEIDPFVLVVEGSVANEQILREGYFTGFGNNPETGQPITHMEWLDRPAPKATIILAVGTCATYGGVHPPAGNPTPAQGVAGHPGLGRGTKAGIPILHLPARPRHP